MFIPESRQRRVREPLLAVATLILLALMPGVRANAESPVNLINAEAS
jgi:hypothetical protein